jgi:hypothetical protein
MVSLTKSNAFYVFYAYEGITNFYEVGIPELYDLYTEYLAHLENEIQQQQLVHYGKTYDDTTYLPDYIVEQYRPMQKNEIYEFLNRNFISFSFSTVANKKKCRVILNSPVRKVW